MAKQKKSRPAKTEWKNLRRKSYMQCGVESLEKCTAILAARTSASKVIYRSGSKCSFKMSWWRTFFGRAMDRRWRFGHDACTTELRKVWQDSDIYCSENILALFPVFIYLIAFTMIAILKKTREKNTYEQDTKRRDEGAGHTTERGSKLSVPLRKIHKY